MLQMPASLFLVFHGGVHLYWDYLEHLGQFKSFFAQQQVLRRASSSISIIIIILVGSILCMRLEF
jgi:hypothetical protein